MENWPSKVQVPLTSDTPYRDAVHKAYREWAVKREHQAAITSQAALGALVPPQGILLTHEGRAALYQEVTLADMSTVWGVTVSPPVWGLTIYAVGADAPSPVERIFDARSIPITEGS